MESDSKRVRYGTLACNLLFAVIVLLLVIVTYPYRGEKLDLQKLEQTVIRTNLDVTRHRDPLRLWVDRGSIPDVLEIGDATSVFDKHEARKFVEGHILPEFNEPNSNDAKKFFEAAATRFLTPLQATMMLTGCYGYIYNDGHHDVPNVIDTHELLTENGIWTMELTPFLLHALEQKAKISTSHDRSTCSCLKDFANPTVVRLNNNEELFEQQVKVGVQDTCTMQNTIDYVMDGRGVALTDKDMDALKKSTLVTSLAVGTVATDEKRQRLHPLHVMLLDLKATATGDVDGILLTFATKYCSLVPDCKAEWKVLPGTARTKQLFYDDLIELTKSVMPHNKLRPPALCTNKDKCSDAPMTSNKRAQLSYASYNAYISKYRSAFQMCTRAGVPQYTTIYLGQMKTEFLYNVGQSFLFLAGLFAFTWSYMIVRHLEHEKAQELSGEPQKKAERDGLRYARYIYAGFVCVVLAWFWLALALWRGTQFYSTKRLIDDNNKNQLIHDTDETSGFFSIFFWLVFGAFFVILCYLFWKFSEKIRDYYKKAQDLYGKARDGMKNFGKPDKPQVKAFASPFLSLVSSTADLNKFNQQITEILGELAPLAQVALDLTVICGLAAMATASVAQRGVEDINVLSAVCVWFLAIGVIAHLSNMLRLLHVYIQHRPDSAHNTHVQSAAHHRVYLAVLLFFMLLAYVVFAGMDASTTTSSHTSAHQVWFALLALAILCGSDLLEQLAENWKEVREDTNDKATTERFWNHLSKKNYFVAWLIIASLFLLHLHRTHGVCEAAVDLKWKTHECFFMRIF